MATTRTLRVGNEGFTLIELIVVLVVIGVAGSIVAVATGRIRERALFDSEARRVFQTLRHARELSLIERRNVAFRVDTETNRYWLDSTGQAPREQRSPKGGTITGKDILFFPKGNSSGGRIQLSDAQGHGFSIKVDPVLGTPVVRRF